MLDLLKNHFLKSRNISETRQRLLDLFFTSEFDLMNKFCGYAKYFDQKTGDTFHVSYIVNLA